MLTLETIQKAHGVLQDHIYHSPCVVSETLSDMLHCHAYQKLENLQITGAFKERGALNRLHHLNHDQCSKGVITASAGNHAQGLAYHAQRMGIKATIVMPEATPLNKVSNVRRFGPEVVLTGRNFDEAFEEAASLQQRYGYTFVHPFDDEAVIAGQGTIALEILNDVPDMEAIIVPIGGGGLIAGIATAAKSIKPDIRIIGIQASQASATFSAFNSGSVMPVRPGSTIADGIAVKSPGHLTFPIIRKYVDHVYLVDEEEIASAILLLLEREKILVEGAGASPLAAMMYREELHELHGKKVAMIVSGGNIDMNLLSRIIERGMVKDGRMARLRIEMSDVPGQLAATAGIFAREHANVMEVYHNRSFLKGAMGKTYLDITLETKGHEHIETIITALENAGYKTHKLS